MSVSNGDFQILNGNNKIDLSQSDLWTMIKDNQYKVTIQLLRSLIRVVFLFCSKGDGT